MTKRSGLTVGSATTPLRLLSPIAVILVALFGLSASAASGSTLPHAQAGIAAERAGLTVIHAWVLGECARTTNESYDHPEIGWPGVGYAYDLRLHNASAHSRADSGLTSPATAHAERGPRLQVNDSRLRLAAEGGAAAADAVPSEITGFTDHGLQQALSRDGGLGVSQSAMEDAVANPVDVVRQANGTFKFVGNNATVVLNSDGRVVTTWATNSAGWRNVP